MTMTHIVHTFEAYSFLYQQEVLLNNKSSKNLFCKVLTLQQIVLIGLQQVETPSMSSLLKGTSRVPLLLYSPLVQLILWLLDNTQSLWVTILNTFCYTMISE